jgi:GDPmannose 4,6-dehydratase
MHLILQQPQPEDWVVSSGENHSVRELCEYIFNKLGLDYKKYVIQNPKYFRPEELQYLKGDSTRIRQLGWKPEYTFYTLLDEMLKCGLEFYKK